MPQGRWHSHFGAPLTGAAGAATPVVPYTDPNAVGSIGLCNQAGQQITSGSISTTPFAWRAVSTQPAPAPYNNAGRTATLVAFQPLEGLPAGDWSGAQMTSSSSYTNPANPMAAATDGDQSLQDFIEQYPPKWDGFVQLRMYLGTANQQPYRLQYPALNIQVTGNTWQAVGGSPVNCASGTAVSIESELLPSSTTSAPTTSTTTTTPAAAGAAQGASDGATPGTDRRFLHGKGARQEVRRWRRQGRPRRLRQPSDTSRSCSESPWPSWCCWRACTSLVLRRRRLAARAADPSDSSSQLFNERRHTMKTLSDAPPSGRSPTATSGRHTGDQHRAGQRRVRVQRGCVDHAAVGADHQSAGGGRPHLLQLVGRRDHGREHLGQSHRRLHSGEHRPAADPTLADLNGFTRPSTAAGPRAGQLERSRSRQLELAERSAPGALGTSSLPVYTGQDYSLSQLTESLPNTDTSTTDGYAGMYVLRLQTFQHNDGGTTSSYDSADISVDPDTGAWTLVYSPQAATTTTLDTPTPASPQNAGASVTLTATVADASAPGTVQFESGGSPVGGAQPVVNGTATLTTTALPTGTDSLSAVYTPTTGAAFAGSTSTNSVSYTIDAPTVPGAPTIGTATPGNTSASVSFTAPASNGGSAITSYTVTATDATTPANGGQTGTGTTSPITVTGLTNGDSYTFTVTATNGVGTGAASGASNAVTPATVPGAPTGVSAVAGQGQASVSFTAPASNGGSAITGYTVTATDATTPANGGQTGTGTTSPISVTGLTNGDSYTFKVTATNAIGAGAASSASSPVTPEATVPGAPDWGLGHAGHGRPASASARPPPTAGPPSPATP